MNRIELIQKIIDKAKFETYLEIGTLKGDSFFPVKCKNKIAIDPNFKISWFKKLSWNRKNPFNKNNRFFEKTSDDFFDWVDDKQILIDKIDVALIDGMHTFKHSLKDVFNILKYLGENGIIIMHDCLPPTELAATPIDYSTKDGMAELRKIRGEWCGDVWKTIAYLRKFQADMIESYVIDTDFGLGIVRSKKDVELPVNVLMSDYKSINKIGYQEMIKYKKNYLGLKQPEFCNELIDKF